MIFVLDIFSMLWHYIMNPKQLILLTDAGLVELNEVRTADMHIIFAWILASNSLVVLLDNLSCFRASRKTKF